MKIKKILAVLLAAAMLMSLCACAGQTSSGTAAATEAAAQKAEATEPAAAANDTAAPYRVKLKMPTMMAIPDAEAIKSVEDAINSYMKNALEITDFELELEMVSLFSYTDEINMQLVAKEPMDIIYTGDLSTAVANGYVNDLTPYLDKELAGACEYLKTMLVCGEIDGTVYAIPCYKGMVMSAKYIYDKAYVKGINYDMSKVQSISDLDPLLAELKAAYPDEIFEVYCNMLEPLIAQEDHTSTVGTYFATIGDSTELVNYFATDAFYKACQKAYEHRQKGYADPEGSMNTQGHDAIVMSGAAKGVVMYHAYSVDTVEQMFTMNNTYGAEFKAVQIATTDMRNNPLVYGIPYTSENPAAAAKMMNLIWTDEFIASALIYGLEGRDWVWVDDTHHSIRYPDGLSIDSVPYTCLYSCGAFGNQFLLYGFDGNTSEEDKAFMQELMDNAWYPPLYGFTPSAERVSTQLAAVSNIYNQYYKTLVYGDVNPDEYLPDFLSALEAAGIQEILQDYQAQVDAWLQR